MANRYYRENLGGPSNPNAPKPLTSNQKRLQAARDEGFGTDEGSSAFLKALNSGKTKVEARGIAAKANIESKARKNGTFNSTAAKAPKPAPKSPSKPTTLPWHGQESKMKGSGKNQSQFSESLKKFSNK